MKLLSPAATSTAKPSQNATHKAGFSLIELTVVLAIAAVIGLAIWKLLPAMRGTANVDAPKLALQDAQTAVEGFILREHRLPCPASALDGVEDCGSSVQVGTLPYRTIGLSSGIPLRYGLYRNANAAVKNDADLGLLKQRYLPTSPVSIIGAANGLDFCVGLKNAIASPNGLAASAGGVSIAYGLAYAGANGVFDGANAGANPIFELASAPQTNAYDDKVITAGHSELFGRLNCPQRLGQANGAARSLYAAFDNDLNAALYADYRKFVVGVRINNLAFAISTLALASADLVIAIAAGATALALAAATAGIGAALAFGVAAAITAAGAAETAAISGVTFAGIALKKAQDQRDAANANKTDLTEPVLARATAAAVQTIQKGLLP